CILQTSDPGGQLFQDALDVGSGAGANSLGSHLGGVRGRAGGQLFQDALDVGSGAGANSLGSHLGGVRGRAGGQLFQDALDVGSGAGANRLGSHRGGVRGRAGGQLFQDALDVGSGAGANSLGSHLGGVRGRAGDSDPVRVTGITGIDVQSTVSSVRAQCTSTGGQISRGAIRLADKTSNPRLAIGHYSSKKEGDSRSCPLS